MTRTRHGTTSHASSGSATCEVVSVCNAVGFPQTVKNSLPKNKKNVQWSMLRGRLSLRPIPGLTIFCFIIVIIPRGQVRACRSDLSETDRWPDRSLARPNRTTTNCVELCITGSSRASQDGGPIPTCTICFAGPSPSPHGGAIVVAISA